MNWNTHCRKIWRLKKMRFRGELEISRRESDSPRGLTDIEIQKSEVSRGFKKLEIQKSDLPG
jgi:hypothetical protein